MENPRILIVGAGVAGLIAARHLEEAGYSPILIEAADEAGGRIRTDRVDGLRLDRGFQVLLTQYREARRYLDFDALDLRRFRPGAIIFSGDGRSVLGDPLREPAELFRTLWSPAGTLLDKWHIFRLSQSLKQMEVTEAFAGYESLPTETYLREYGFSDRIIERFFRPFFGGIFLENELRTPAAMFRFVFKMFAEGDAALPAEGIGAIPRQLADALRQTTFLYDSPAVAVEGRELRLANGKSLSFDALILACPPGELVPNLAGPALSWNRTVNLYFRAERAPLPGRHIALVADRDSPINNFCTLTEVAPAYAESGALLSVTLKTGFSTLVEPPEVAHELRQRLRDKHLELEFVRRYDIPLALPDLPTIYYEQAPEQTRLNDHLFLAGDHQLNGSLDAAMRSGRNAALGVIGALA
jgi:hypothetical protein